MPSTSEQAFGNHQMAQECSSLWMQKLSHICDASRCHGSSGTIVFLLPAPGPREVLLCIRREDAYIERLLNIEQRFWSQIQSRR